MTTLQHRIRRRVVVAISAPFAALMALGIVALAGVGPAHANNLGNATATPSTKLQNGQVVSVSISNFPANVTVGVVECDTRVVTTSDKGYCDLRTPSVITTDASGNGSGTYKVSTGSSFVSGNGQGVCDPTHSCYLVFATVGQATETDAIAPVSFVSGSVSSPTPGPTTAPGSGTPSTIQAGPAHRTVKAGARTKFTIVVRSTGSAPTGSIVVTQGSRKLLVTLVPSSGKVVFNHKLGAGRHKLKINYSGDTAHLPSFTTVIVTVKR